MNFRDFFKNGIIYLDGGMGTLLQAAGLEAGEHPERWNLTHPETIQRIHRDYYDAGSHVVNTNTFGANALKFSDAELEKIIKAAVQNAESARNSSIGKQEKFIALDIGPTGKLLKPYGDLDFEDAVEIFAKTVRIGVSCGVDLIMIETMSDSYETKAALLAAKENCDLPVFVSNAYGEDGKLMTGASPEAMVAMLEGMRADAIGVNCSLGPEQLRPVVQRMLACASVPILLKPNAGLPQSRDGRTEYDVSPKAFAEAVTEMIGMGVRVAGGCCGTTPAYIKALVERSAPLSPVVPEKKSLTTVSSYTHAVTFDRDPVLIGERINPTGKKAFQEALKENNIDYLLQEGLRQADCGVQILDVNVGMPGIDECDMLCRATEALQAIIDLPLQIDTSNVNAMEAALRRYNGKAMINSVNGKEESMRAVFPLVQKYGGLVVALTLDEKGIPTTAQGRVEIAKRILGVASEYGIGKNDLIFDPLAMTVSADSNAASVTLEAVRRIREELGCHTSLGVSNVSFGLPRRDLVNSTFFAMALENRLSAAIMNPYAEGMMQVWYAYRALKGLDDNCAEYINYAPTCTENVQSATTTASVKDNARSAETLTELQSAIVKGRAKVAGDMTDAMLQTVPPLEIVQTQIIPALDVVGKGFEKNRIYLPQLLMSAEAAKQAFACIKARMQTTSASAEKRMKIVIATVKGDIHDIGKNIVKLLLENYGYDVTDLGKDVPPERVVEHVVAHHVSLVGLSALMTTTVPAMEETIRQLRMNAPWCKIMVGGAVLNADYAARIGADRYCKDAMESVRYAESLHQNT